MLRERLREVEWKSVAVIAVPLLIIVLTISFLLLKEDGVSNDALRRAQYSESANDVEIHEPAPSKKVGEYALVTHEATINELPPLDEDAPMEKEASASAGVKQSEPEPESIIDPHEDGIPVPEDEVATGEPVATEGEVDDATAENTMPEEGDRLAGPFTISDESGAYMVDFYPADAFLASGRFASEEEADFSIDALEELLAGVDAKDVQQFGFIKGQEHSGAYVSHSYQEDAPPLFRAYITDGDTVAVIEGNIEATKNGYRPDFLTTFNLTETQEK